MAAIAIDVGITLAAFLGMEAFAWATHRYLMHGRLGWIWHSSHHSEHNRLGEGGGAELNDLFAAVFALPAIVLFIIGAQPGLRPLWFAGLGVTLYGMMYWIVHDGFVHQRWPLRIRAKRGYVKRLVQAHRLHHSTHGRTGAVSFGFLYAREPRHLKAKLQAAARGPAGRPVTSSERIGRMEARPRTLVRAAAPRRDRSPS